MNQVRALVLTGYGINCEEETAAAYRLAGGGADIVHLNDVFAGTCSIHDYHVLNLPGGFSFGDDLTAGKALANRLRHRRLPSGVPFLDELRTFLDHGNFILGICNGFQALVKLGLLPALKTLQGQKVTLTHNDSGQFEDRWCRCRVNPNSSTPFLAGLDVLDLPVRHGEGRLLIRDERVKAEIKSLALNCLSYCDEDGKPTGEYPANPNGADLHCAALTDRTGRVLGMMPHPEACLSLYNHPDWPQRQRAAPAISEEGDGLRVFHNIVTHIKMTRKLGENP